jgi:hypothetical protein
MPNFDQLIAELIGVQRSTYAPRPRRGLPGRHAAFLKAMDDLTSMNSTPATSEDNASFSNDDDDMTTLGKALEKISAARLQLRTDPGDLNPDQVREHLKKLDLMEQKLRAAAPADGMMAKALAGSISPLEVAKTLRARLAAGQIEPAAMAKAEALIHGLGGF